METRSVRRKQGRPLCRKRGKQLQKRVKALKIQRDNVIQSRRKTGDLQSSDAKEMARWQSSSLETKQGKQLRHAITSPVKTSGKVEQGRKLQHQIEAFKQQREHLIQSRRQKKSDAQQRMQEVKEKTTPQGAMHGASSPFNPGWPAHAYTQGATPGLKPYTSTVSPPSLPQAPPPPYPFPSDPRLLHSIYNGFPAALPGLDAQPVDPRYARNGYLKHKTNLLDPAQLLPGSGGHILPGFPASFGQHSSSFGSRDAKEQLDYLKSGEIPSAKLLYPEAKLDNYAPPAANVYSNFQKSPFENSVDSKPTYLDDGHSSYLPPIGTYLKIKQNEAAHVKAPEYPDVIVGTVPGYTDVSTMSGRTSTGSVSGTFGTNPADSRPPQFGEQKIFTHKDKLKKHLIDRHERSISSGSQVPQIGQNEGYFSSAQIDSFAAAFAGGTPYNSTSVSAPTRPVSSADASLISGVPPPRDLEHSLFKDPYSKENASNDMASKVAAEIFREASKLKSTRDPFERSLANASSVPDIIRTGLLRSPFQPTDMNPNLLQPNPHRPSSNSSMNSVDLKMRRPSSNQSAHSSEGKIYRPSSNQSAQSSDGKIYRPSSNQSAHSLELRSPVDFRPENMLQGNPHAHLSMKNNEPVSQNFWSQFGSFPPNIALDRSSSGLQGTHADQMKELMPASATSMMAMEHPKTSSSQGLVQSFHHSGNTGHKDVADRRRVEKPKRRPVEVDPNIREKVDAKVQEIMAAYKLKEQERTNQPKVGIDQSSHQSSFTHPTVSQGNQLMLGSSTEAPVFNSHLKRTPNEHMSAKSKSDRLLESLVNVANQGRPSEQGGTVSWNKESSAMDPRRVYNNPSEKVLDMSNSKKESVPLDFAGIFQKCDRNRDSDEVNWMNHMKEPNRYLQQGEQMAETKKRDYNEWKTEMAPENLNKGDALVPASMGGSVHCCDECDKVGINFSERCKNKNKYDLWKAMHVDQRHDQMKNTLDPSRNSWMVSKQMEHVEYYSRNKSDYKKEKDDGQSSYKSKMADLIKKEVVKSGVSVNSVDLEMKPGVHKQFLEGFADARQHVQKLWKQTHVRDHIRNVLNNEKMETIAGDPYKFEDSIQKTVSSQGLNISKKIGSKPFGYKSSYSSFKKVHKTYPKLVKKAQVNEKTKRGEKDNFSEKLIKNLGFPPLTQQDLVTKRQKVSNEVINGFLSSANCLLTVEDKCERGDEVPLADSSPPSSQVTTSAAAAAAHTIVNIPTTSSFPSQLNNNRETNLPKMGIVKNQQQSLRRSRSMDSLCCKSDTSKQLWKPRSRSLDRLSLGSQLDFNSRPGPQQKFDIRMQVDDGGNVPLSDPNVEKITGQISDLKDMVTGQTADSNLKNNSVAPVPVCDCLGPNGMFNEAVEGPYYSHLGAGSTVETIRVLLEQRFGIGGKAIRIEKVRYSGKEGKSSQGCPIAKWVIRRSSVDEKYLAVIRHRPGHFCQQAWLIIGLVAWEGVPTAQADHLYDYLCNTLPSNGHETERRCGSNERKMCACQGIDLKKRGASFSFGCSWSMYFNGCKFARSQVARKFKLKDSSKEVSLEDTLQNLATTVGPLYKQAAPEAHQNQCHYSLQAGDCRLGKEAGGPFSGVTACVDFCAHAHKDIHNMNNGSTVVVTLTKHRGLSKPEDEQLHVLPLYVLEPTDEQGSYDGQYDKIKNGSLEVLHNFPLEARIRSYPLASCKKRQKNPAKKGTAAPRKRTFKPVNGRSSPFGAPSLQSDPKKMMPNKGRTCMSGPQPGRPIGGVCNNAEVDSRIDYSREPPLTYEDFIALQSHADYRNIRDRFWNFYNTKGVFPPRSYLIGGMQPNGVLNQHHGMHGAPKQHGIHGVSKHHDMHGVSKYHDMPGISKQHDMHGISKQHDMHGVSKQHDMHGVPKQHDMHKGNFYGSNQRGQLPTESYPNVHPAFTAGKMNTDRGVGDRSQSVGRPEALGMSERTSADSRTFSNSSVPQQNTSAETTSNSVALTNDGSNMHRSSSVPLEQNKMAASHSQQQYHVPLPSSRAIVVQNPFNDHSQPTRNQSAIPPEGLSQSASGVNNLNHLPADSERQSRCKSPTSSWYSAINVQTAAARAPMLQTAASSAPILHRPSSGVSNYAPKQATQNQSQTQPDPSNMQEKSLSKSWDFSVGKQQTNDNGTRNAQSPLELLSRAVEMRSKDMDGAGSRMFGNYLGASSNESSENVYSSNDRQHSDVNNANSTGFATAAGQSHALDAGIVKDITHEEMHNRNDVNSENYLRQNTRVPNSSADISHDQVNMEQSVSNTNSNHQQNAMNLNETNVASPMPRYSSEQPATPVADPNIHSVSQEADSQPSVASSVPLHEPHSDKAETQQRQSDATLHQNHATAKPQNMDIQSTESVRPSYDQNRVPQDLPKSPQYQPEMSQDNRTLIQGQNVKAHNPFGWSHDQSRFPQESVKMSHDQQKLSHDQTSAQSSALSSDDSNRMSYDLSKTSHSQELPHDLSSLPHDLSKTSHDFSKPLHGQTPLYDGRGWSSISTTSHDSSKVTHSHNIPHDQYQPRHDPNVSHDVSIPSQRQNLSSSSSIPSSASYDLSRPSFSQSQSQDPSKLSNSHEKSSFDLSKSSHNHSLPQDHNGPSNGLNSSSLDLSKPQYGQTWSQNHSGPHHDPNVSSLNLSKSNISSDQSRMSNNSSHDLSKSTQNQAWSQDHQRSSDNPYRTAQSVTQPTFDPAQAHNGPNRTPHDLSGQSGQFGDRQGVMHEKYQSPHGLPSSLPGAANNSNQHLGNAESYRQTQMNHPNPPPYPVNNMTQGQYPKPSGQPSHSSNDQKQIPHGMPPTQPHQPRSNPNHPIWSMYNYSAEQLAKHEQLNAMTAKYLQENCEESTLDPNILKCEMEYNEAAFRDPEIGGVAIALCHGAVLFEVAKRELHATTGLKSPNRYHPTRISLVFYQHKNLNNEVHGRYAYAKKLEDMKQKRISQMQEEKGFVNMTEIENSFKGGKKRKLDEVMVEDEYDIMKSSAAQYRYMMECNARRDDAFTTPTVSTKWIAPQPMVTGPYQKWL